MTEPISPEPDEPRSEDTATGLVEEIRHEIEEVVEHVPKQVRWTVRKLVTLGITALVALLVLAVVSIVLYYANRTELAAQELTLYLNHTLSSRSDVQIDVSDIRGNPFQRIRLVHPRVVFRDGGAPILEAPWIELGYSPLALLRNENRSMDITIESPVIRLGKRPDGTLRFPEWRTKGHTGRPSAVDVRFRMHNGSIVLPEPGQRIDGLDIDALLGTGVQSHASVRRLRWRSGLFETKDLELTGEIAAGDSVQFRIGRLSTTEFALSASGGWKKGERTKELHVDLRRLSWRWLARVTKNGAFDVPGTAAATFDARGDSTWAGTFGTKVEWNGLPAEGGGAFTFRDARLRIEPLTARTPAGDLRGWAGYARAGWEVGGDVTNGEPSLWDAIGISGWPKGVLNGRFRYAVDTRVKGQPNGSVLASLGPSELDRWRADSCGVTVALPAHGTRTFDVHAVRRGGRFTLHGETTPTGWDGTYQIDGLPLDEWPDGRATGIRGMLETGAGTVSSGKGTLSVTGQLAGSGTDWLGMHAAKWRLGTVSGALQPKPDLTATGVLGDVMFLGLHFDSLASPVRLGDRTLELLDTRAQAGDTLITLAGRADWDDHGWQLDLSRATATSSQLHWTAEPPLQLAGDTQGVTFRRLVAHDAGGTLTATGRWAVPGGSYDWHGEVTNADLSRLGLPPEWGFGGLGSGTLRVEGASGDPRWAFDGRASRPSFDGHRGDSLEVSLDGAMGRVGIERLSFVIGGGELAVHGRIERMARPWPDSLTGTAVSRWLVGAGQWSGTVDSKRFPIERVTGLFPASAGWSGRMDGSVGFAGSPAEPVLDVKAVVAPLTWRDFGLERLEAEARYSNERLEVSKLTASRFGLESSAEGNVPIRLAFDRSWELLDQPMDAVVRVRQGDLRLLPRLLPQIAMASGSLEADATVRGTPLAPELNGRGRVTGGSFRLSGRGEVLKQVQAWFRMSASTVTLDSLTAREGEDGRVRASGTVSLHRLVPSAYQLNVALSDFTAADPGIYAAEFDGNFLVKDGPHLNGQWLPYVTGRATVNRAVILIDFANQTEAAQLAASNPPLYWLYRIDLTAKSNLHWQPPDGDIEFSADLTAEQTPTELRMYGEMQSLRGTYYFLSNRFNVEHATLTFDNVSGLNPMIDAQATARVVPLSAPAATETTSPSEKTNQPHDVTVKLTGRAKEPEIAFSSDPSDWGEDEILQQLTIGRFYASKSGGRVPSSDPFDNYLTRAINRTLSAEMSRAFRGYVNDWGIEREQGGLFAGKGEVIVGVGSQVTRNLMVRYRQRVPGLGRDVVAPTPNTSTTLPFERDIEAEYRLNRFFLVNSQLTQRRTLTSPAANISTRPEFNVDLKARWEY